MIGCKFNGGVNVIEISSEGLEVVKGVCPYHEDVVYEGLCSLYQRFEVIVYKL